MEEKERLKAEKAAEKIAIKALKEEQRKSEKELKRKERLNKLLVKEAKIAELRKKNVEEIRKVENAPV